MAAKNDLFPSFVLRGHVSDVTCLSFSSASVSHSSIGASSAIDANITASLFSGSSDGEVKIWNMNSRRSIFTFQHCPQSQSSSSPGVNTGVLNVEYLPNGRLLTQGRDGYVRIWDLNGTISEPLFSVNSNSYSFCRCAVLPDSYNVNDGRGDGDMNRDPFLLITPSTSSSQSSFCLWDLRCQSLIHTFDMNDGGMCMSLSIVSNPRSNAIIAISGYENGHLTTWDVAQKTLICDTSLHSAPLLSFGIHPSMESGMSGSTEPFLVPFSLNTAENSITPLVPHISLPDDKCGISEISYRNDGRIFATAGWDRRVRLFSTKKFRPLAILKYHSGSVNAIAFAKGDNLGWLACGSKDSRISVYSLYPS